MAKLGRPRKAVEHGTRIAYAHKGCRCKDCRQAQAKYMRDRYKRRKMEAFAK